MKRSRLFSPLLLAFAFLFPVSCSDDPTGATVTQLLVIEAFLFAGEPVRDVRVTETIPLSSEDKTPVPINDAAVRLIRDGVAYDLVPSGTGGYYEYPGDLAVAVGDRFAIEVTSSGETATGETTVPPPPTNLVLSSSVVYAREFGRGRTRGGGGISDPSEELGVTWSNPDRLLHFVVVESMEDDPEPIIPEEIRQRIGGTFRFVSTPTDDDATTITAITLEFLGQHRLKVYRINEEYAQLYQNREQDSRDLNEPSSNIRNGLGVFSAFSSDSAFFTVLRR